MSKKIIIIGLFAVIMCFSLIGCEKEETPNNNNNNNQQQEEILNNNDNNNQQLDETSNDTLGIGKYKVEKGNNSVSVVTNDGSGIATTTYYFIDNVISRAELVEEFSSTTIAETSYNAIKNEPAIMNSYSDIKLDGKKVVLTVKSEILGAYSTFDYNGFYDLMIDTYQAYID